VGHYTNPRDLLDGGIAGTPDLAFYNPNGSWDVENHGVPPDIEVELDPKALRQGHDPQLEKAVEAVMDLLKKNPPPPRLTIRPILIITRRSTPQRLVSSQRSVWVSHARINLAMVWSCMKDVPS
jgi:C-terminal processing protease CtpA/Prc